MKRNETNNNKGFSLVELIVVIAIMAVLIGVLAPTFTKYVERARKSTDVQNAASIVTAVQTYAADPMAASTLATGTIVLSVTDTAVTDAGVCSNTTLSDALTDAGIDTVGLSSTRWGDAANASVTITVTVDATDGSVTCASSGESSTQNLLNGIYD